MTLRGEIESFPLETVVQLIHSTGKTGQLEVRSATGTGGTLGFDDGRLIAAVTGDDIGEPALGAVFAVATGAFEFIPWNDAPAANLSGDLDQLLDKAVEERDRINAIRAIVPDDRSRFRLSERAAEKGDITLSADQWRTLLAVNGDRDVPAVAEHLKAGLTVTRASLAGLVDAGFIDLVDPPSEDPPQSASPSWAPAAEPEPQAPPPREPEPQWSAPPPVWSGPEPEARPEPQPEPQSDAPPAQSDPRSDPWGALTETAPAAAEPEPEPLPQSWDQSASVGRRWEPEVQAPPPAQWGGQPERETREPDRREDLAAALDARMSTPAAEPDLSPAPEPEVAPPPSPIDIPPANDDRLAALSGVFGPAQPVTPDVVAPPQADRISEWSRITRPQPAEPEADAAPESAPEEKKKGLFGFLKREEQSDSSASTATAASGRGGQLASLANALLGEYNNGQYGKGRLDDRMANLLMRVDEQADPIDRPLPIVDDRIDAQALDRENVPEQQVVPYLAILVSQIYEDAERTFGKDKAKRGYKAAQHQVFGSDASALSSPDIAGKLPRV
ncbi:MAG: DUF4388 domain-containing protein [Chloroflexota bacterium]|nr:DUF4388 domain-containing protein [Chloroflexota bacterium]